MMFNTTTDLGMERIYAPHPFYSKIRCSQERLDNLKWEVPKVEDQKRSSYEEEIEH
jgi:hypothetical protein